MYHYRIRKYIGAYVAAMGGVDMIVFAGGIGENSPETREASCEGLDYMNIRVDHEKNQGIRSKECVISPDNAQVKVMVVPTNEELVIAEDTMRIISEMKKQ